MKQKSRFSKYRLILVIAFLLIGTLFTAPVAIKTEDSQYLWHKNPCYNNAALTSPDGFHLYVEPIEGTEVIVFSENGVLKAFPETTEWEKRPSEYRITYEELADMREFESAFLSPIVWYPRYDLFYDESGGMDTRNSETFVDYIGVIVKKDGFIVSSSLYKLTGTGANWTGTVEELAVFEYPFLNCFVTEMHVKSELRRITATDRILTLCGLTKEPTTPAWDEESGWKDWQPPHSPTYHP